MDTSVTDLPPQAIAVIGLRLPSLDPRLSFAVVGGCAKTLLKIDVSAALDHSPASRRISKGFGQHLCRTE